MYSVRKTVEISGAHCLSLPYPSKCNGVHGHNWLVTVEVAGKCLNESGMLIDFSKIKSVVSRLDHKNLNTIMEPATAEEMCWWVASQVQDELKIEYGAQMLRDNAPEVVVPEVVMVEVQESEGNVARWTK
jgi:6-pyruvoyltetrahydropterin/6-carboxytetrahydropterin synthase